MIANDCNTLPLDERIEMARGVCARSVLSLDERREIAQARVPAVSLVSAGTGHVKEGQGEATLCLYVLSKCLRSTI